MKISSLLLGIFIFGTVILGFYGLLSDLAGDNGYDIAIDEKYSATYDKTETLSTEIADKYNTLMNTTFSKETSYFTAIVDATSLVKQIVVTPLSLISIIVTDIISPDTGLGLPQWVTTLALCCIVIFVLFGFVAIIMKNYEI